MLIAKTCLDLHVISQPFCDLTACQLEDVTRKRGYFRFFVGDITYINTDPVPMHECEGSCSPESRCKPNEFSPVILTLTAKANKGGLYIE